MEFILLAYGLIFTLFPRESWKFTQGLLVKSDDPSSAALLLYRIMGATALIVALILLYIKYASVS
jgi:uncharacterized protein YjeT (DUF2065 family)